MEEEWGCPVFFRENSRLLFEWLHRGDQFCQECTGDDNCLQEPYED